MSIEFDRRVQVNKIIESQLPEFVVADFPLATDFLKQYYISQEYQGGATDLIDNLDRYLKVDNLVPEVITGTTTLPQILLLLIQPLQLLQLRDFLVLMVLLRLMMK